MTAGPLYDVAVVGAGVVGASIAWRLAARGARVCVIDADDPGGRGSRAAAGVAVPSVRLLGDPLMLDFTGQGRAQLLADVEQLTGTEPAALRSHVGVLRIIRDARQRDELAASAPPGALGHWLDGDDLAAREPLLATDRFHGAYFDPDGFMVDAAGYVGRIVRAAVAAGAEAYLGTTVLGVEEEPDGIALRTTGMRVTADRVVVASGAWTATVPGVPPLAVRPVRGQLMRTDSGGQTLRHLVSAAVYAAPAPDGSVVVGATEEDAGFTEAVTPEGLLVLAAFLGRALPALARGRLHACWSGLRAGSGDGRPLLGPVSGTGRLLVAAGHGGQGILTGALTGRVIADLLDHGHDEWCAVFDARREIPR